VEVGVEVGVEGGEEVGVGLLYHPYHPPRTLSQAS
jgi:hypothetical protein